MKLRRIIFASTAFLLLFVKFALDVISKNIELQWTGFFLLRELLTAGVFVSIVFALHTPGGRREPNPARKLGLLLIFTLAALIATLLLGTLPADGFDQKGQQLLPLDYMTLFISSLLSLVMGVYGLLSLRILRDLILHTRKRWTARLFWLLVILLVGAAVSTLLRPLAEPVLLALTPILFALTIVAGVANSFRLPWIVYLTRRDKLFTLAYGFFLFLCLLGLNVYFANSQLLQRSLLYYSMPLREFIRLMLVITNVYCGMAFISTLFHLPTADAFERKRSEVTSLSNLSKLITQVFDFNDLVDTVTTMTMRVCEAKSAWLEEIHWVEDVSPVLSDESPGRAMETGSPAYHVHIASLKNITPQEIAELVPEGAASLRNAVIRERKAVIADDLLKDVRFASGGEAKRASGSMVVVPLVSHVGLSGILYVIKETSYGFVKDDVELITAFADQAAVAIENSRLIQRSIERERLLKEMMLAQEMQKKLLPQEVPVFPSLEIDAVSTPAFEVGGDYYDFMHLSPTRMGIVVGDVSGKGVSAAFYMSEVKGIFQALGRMYDSPREFMVKANDALTGSIDRHSFVSLIYGIVDVTSGYLSISRAGHCPLLHVSGKEVRYVRPNGMGLGLTAGKLFEESIEEHTLRLQPGDVCLFYTDGVTEARQDGEEFGYERLLALVQRVKDKSAAAIKNDIIATIQEFTGDQPSHDDLTVVVLKWLGNPVVRTKEFSNAEAHP
jgi:sigma-B regulation protein RsbU (phosphoserine phosphatase)